MSVPLVKLVKTPEKLGKKKNLSGAQRENWTYFPRFCIFIINHLLCWPELWMRSSVHYFFKRSFLCFLKACAPFCFVKKKKKKRWPWFVSLTPSGGKNKEACESHWTAGGRETRMLFLTQTDTSVFTCNLTESPQGASIDWWPSIFTQDLN